MSVKSIERYGLIFTCFSSRTIHIEILDDLTTDAFINALQCFIAIRGAVRQIRSDQGTNFVGAKNEMIKAPERSGRRHSEDLPGRETLRLHNECS